MGLLKRKKPAELAAPQRKAEVWQTCDRCNGQGDTVEYENLMASRKKAPERCTKCNGRGEVRA